MGYADLDSAKAQLDLSDDSDPKPEHVALLEQLDEEMSRAFELKVGRRWSGSPAADTSRIFWAGPYGTLLLDPPARSITSITVGGTVVGNTMTGGEVISASQLANRLVDQDGWILGLNRPDSASLLNGWWGDFYWIRTNGRFPVLVTGKFAGADDGEDVPSEVVAAVTFIVVEEFRMRTSSPAGQVGAEGLVTRPRNPWTFTVVTTALEAHKLPQLVAF